MKTNHNYWKKKLVHTLMLVSALLIAATMVTSAAIPGTMQTAKPIRIIDKNVNAISLATPTIVTNKLQAPAISEDVQQSGESQPSGGRSLIWDNGLPDGVNGLSFGIWTGYNRELTDEFITTMPVIVQGGTMRMLIYSAAGYDHVANVDVRIFPDNSGVPGTTHIYEVLSATFVAVNTGNTYFSRPEILVTVTGLNAILSTPGTYWMQFQVTANPAENCFWLTSAKIGSQCYLAYPDYGYNRWVPGSTVFSAEYGISYTLEGIPMGVTHDVGVTSIISPAAGNIQQFVPKVKLINNGGQTETAVPVDMDINRWIPPTPPVYSMSEEFPGTTFPPTGWSTLGGTASGWRRSTGSQAGGTAPQAYCYYTYADPMDWLMGPAVDTSMVTNHLYLDWRSMYDWYTGSTYAWVQTRANAGDAWTDRQPWANPVTADIPAARYVIDITDDIGTGTQVRFIRDGTYSNFRYWYVDNVYIYSSTPGYYVDDYYQSLTVDIPVGEMELTFPTWTPYGYQSAENVDIQYQAIAATHLTGDEIPEDDSQTKTFILHYPYLHDVGVDAILSPVEDGLATSFPVKAVIKNYGQFPERWFNTDIQIGAELHTYTINTDFEADNGGFTAAGSYSLWAWGVPTSGPGAAHSGSKLWGTVLGGNYVNYANERLESPAFTVPASAKLSFWHWYYTENYYDGGNVKISVAPYTTWTILGSYLNPYNEDALSTINAGCPGEPGFSGSGGQSWNNIIFDLGAYAGQSVKIRFHFGSDSSVSSYPGWYVDDVAVYQVSVDPEYDDEDWQGQDYLQPGETREITFDTFIPEALAEGNSGDITYVVSACTTLTGDTHPANDCNVEDFTLTYVHDVTIKKFNEPSSAKGSLGDVIFSQRAYTPDESWSFYTSDIGAGYLCQDDFWDLVDPITDVEWCGLPLIYSGGWSQGNPTGMLFDITFYTDASGAPGSVVATFTDLEPTFEAGDIYGGAYQAYDFAVDLPDAVILADGWIGIQSHDASDGSWILLSGSPEGNANALQNGGALSDSLAFSLTTGGGGGGGYPPITVYVKKGTSEPIQVLINNVGTFPETCTVNVEMREFITDTENGTEVYSDSVSGIVLDPLGDEQAVDFQAQLFALEGPYGIYANLIPGSTDDVPGNNVKALGVGSDGTAPVTTHAITPASPDGENGWYASDVTIKLTATDPTVAEISSGVAKIEYQIDGGAWQTYTGTAGFKITTDGQHTVKYKATDKVGNVEAEKTIPVIKLDKTKPTIFMTYNVTGGNAIQGWQITFYVTANDATSGLDSCEFYYNEFIQETVTGPGPEYQWSYNFTDLPNVIVKAIVYDVTGNNNFDEIENPDEIVTQQSQSQTLHTLLKTYL